MPFEHRIMRWQFAAMMRQRGITWPDLRQELGNISNARMGQLMKQSVHSDQVLFRLEDAIERITERKHRARGHTDNDVSCAVFTACVEDQALLRAKNGAMEQWREHQTSNGVLTPTTPGDSESEGRPTTPSFVTAQS